MAVDMGFKSPAVWVSSKKGLKSDERTPIFSWVTQNMEPPVVQTSEVQTKRKTPS
jgi:hypothetical protein